LLDFTAVTIPILDEQESERLAVRRKRSAGGSRRQIGAKQRQGLARPTRLSGHDAHVPLATNPRCVPYGFGHRDLLAVAARVADEKQPGVGGRHRAEERDQHRDANGTVYPTSCWPSTVPKLLERGRGEENQRRHGRRQPIGGPRCIGDHHAQNEDEQKPDDQEQSRWLRSQKSHRGTEQHQSEGDRVQQARR
jgi:hypothetical protein